MWLLAKTNDANEVFLRSFLSPTEPIALFVEIIKDWIMKPLRDQHVKPKSKATFKCELFKDTPNWKWMKGDAQLAPSDKVEINKDGNDVTLTINNCQPDDVSDYTLEVEDRRYTAKLTLGGLCVSAEVFGERSVYELEGAIMSPCFRAGG